ncbi:MAG: class I SAM-dependent methyltransferase [Pyrinomonadaceae bacterium]
MNPSPIRKISDTARWAAVYRARETERSDAVFRDPFARQLAGDRGEDIANAVKFSTQNSWSWIARTYVFDAFILDQLRQGCDLVINLAAGLDARPYRMELPANFKWIEVDLPEVIEYKQEVLSGATPTCLLERVAVDLTDVAARRELFHRLGRRGGKALIVTEGFLIYFTDDEAAAFAQDLHVPANFQNWIMDLTSPGLLELLKKRMGEQMGEGAVLRFAPADAFNFFLQYGWKITEARSLIKAASRIDRLPWLLKFLAVLSPEFPKPKQASKPWGGVVVLSR